MITRPIGKKALVRRYPGVCLACVRGTRVYLRRHTNSGLAARRGKARAGLAVRSATRKRARIIVTPLANRFIRKYQYIFLLSGCWEGSCLIHVPACVPRVCAGMISASHPPARLWGRARGAGRRTKEMTSRGDSLSQWFRMSRHDCARLTTPSRPRPAFPAAASLPTMLRPHAATLVRRSPPRPRRPRLRRHSPGRV